MGVTTTAPRKATKLRLFAIFFVVFLALTSACAQPAAPRPVDPGNVGLLAFCGYQDALANSKADWAVMASAESEFEVSLAAADRLERSHFAASSALAKVTPESDLYPSAQYVTSELIKFTLIFRDLKRAIIYQDNAALQEAQGDYATTYNTFKSEVETGALPGAAAFTAIFGGGTSSCAGIVTNVFPASSGYSDAEPINRTVCSNGSGQYSVADLFSELGAAEIDRNDAAPFIAAYVEIGFRMQPLLELSSGPLLNGLASIFSGIMTLDYLFNLASTSAEIYDETFLLIVDGLKQTRSSCGDLGIDV
jgi:hypothetical protein